MILPEYYEYCSRVPMLSGARALDELPLYLADMKATRPMIITDKGVNAAGLIKVVTKALNKIKSPVIFDNTPMDSDILTCSEVADLYRKKKCDAIIAVGGGSVLDTAKGVNILVSLGGDDLLKYSGAGVINKKLKPMIAVPTTAGTGSEMTLVAVISDNQRHLKLTFVSYFLLPDLAVLDPRMTVTLPPHITAMTAMDAMTHACEAYTCLGKNPLSDTFALKSIELISQNLLNVMDKPNDTTGRLALANAAAMAGMAFSNSMVGMVHNLAHSLGAVCHIPHGLANSVILPYGLEYNLHKNSALVARLLYPLAGPEKYKNTPRKKRAEAAIAEIRDINQALYLKTAGKHATSLKDIMNREQMSAVPRDILPQVAQAALRDAASIYNPEEITYEDALMVLNYAWEGEPLNRSRVRKGRRKISF